MLHLNLCSVIYLGQVKHLSSLHLKIPKPGKDRLSLVVAHVRDKLPTSTCSATTTLPYRDKPTLLG